MPGSGVHVRRLGHQPREADSCLFTNLNESSISDAESHKWTFKVRGSISRAAM
jgi:hypothetical protein